MGIPLMRASARRGRLRAMNRIPVIYVDCDVPEGVTLDEYRRRACVARPRRRLGLRRLLGRRSAVA